MQRRRRVLGQGMTEYIIIVALIAIAAIGVYNLYGRTMRHQTAAMAGTMATKEAAAKIGLENFSEPAATK
ncbi:MAG: pilus assembly protein [Burkholderiales bacterium]|nr:pilus assembly protein [Burkholderiales bacterium]